MVGSEEDISPRVDTGDLPNEVNPAEHLRIFDEDGRESLGIYVPAHLQHYGQKFSEIIAAGVRELLEERGVDPEIIKSVGARTATRVSLRVLVNAIDLGYASRVLEERAGLLTLDRSDRFKG